MKKVKSGIAIALCALAIGAAHLPIARADPHSGQSLNVAIVGGTAVINGGAFATTGSGPSGSFTDFHFFTLAVADVSTANLGPGGVCGASGCDTVLLNVASTDMNCNTGNLSTGAKSDLVGFTSGGGKLIIYDSECPAADYSWLPFPFTTNNPGAFGASGTFNIVEESFLSSSDPANSHFIDASLLGSGTDAVGDSNVFVTFDSNWCAANTATNVNAVTGPVRVYAHNGSGLILYSGLDVDTMFDATPPDASTADGNLAKLWLQELQQPLDGSGLPCGVVVSGIALAPASASNPVGGSHTVTALVTENAVPKAGVLVTFTVVSGPNTGATGTCNPADCKTDAAGQVTFTYTSNGTAGTDEVQACFTDAQGNSRCSDNVTKTWTAPTSVTFELTPADATNDVDTPHTVTISVAVDGSPEANVVVDFAVAGANTAAGSCTTDSSGQCTFTYTGTNAGTDSITATASVAGAAQEATASKTWESPITPGCEVEGEGRLSTNPRASFDFEVEMDPDTGLPGGRVVFRDGAIGQRFISTEILSLNISGTSATIEGTGTVDGTSVDFTLEVADLGESHLDTFKIELSNGYTAIGNASGDGIEIECDDDNDGDGDNDDQDDDDHDDDDHDGDDDR